MSFQILEVKTLLRTSGLEEWLSQVVELLLASLLTGGTRMGGGGLRPLGMGREDEGRAGSASL